MRPVSKNEDVAVEGDGLVANNLTRYNEIGLERQGSPAREAAATGASWIGSIGNVAFAPSVGNFAVTAGTKARPCGLVNSQHGETVAMKMILSCAVLAFVVAGMTDAADAKGCIKGAVVGGAAGHFAHHHGALGAAAGCVIGHHEANKNRTQNQNQNQSH